MTRHLTVFLMACCLSLLVLGCSGGSNSSPSTPTSEPGAAAPLEPDTPTDQTQTPPTLPAVPPPTPPTVPGLPPPPAPPTPEVPPQAPVRVPPATPPPFPYRLVDLGPVTVRMLDGESRTVVGDVLMQQGGQASILYPTSQVLGTLPAGVFSSAHGISQAVIVGESATGTFSLLTHAFRWTQTSGMTDLGTAGAADLFSSASAINATGIVAGYGDSVDRTLIVPILWHGGQVTLLPTFGLHNAFTQAINPSGHTVGFASIPTGMTHAVLWPPEGEIIDLHTTDGPFSIALGINQPGQIVGYTLTMQGQVGFVWLSLTGMLLLPPLKNDIASGASGINDAGVIVGQSIPLAKNINEETSHAVRWVNGQPSPLTDLIAPAHEWVLLRGISINQEGAIVGAGILNGVDHGFLLLPAGP